MPHMDEMLLPDLSSHNFRSLSLRSDPHVPLLSAGYISAKYLLTFLLPTGLPLQATVLYLLFANKQKPFHPPASGPIKLDFTALIEFASKSFCSLFFFSIEATSPIMKVEQVIVVLK